MSGALGHFSYWDDILEEALKFNQRIWSIFQSELSHKDNPLPKKLRMDIIRLSAIIDKRIFETMAEPSPEKLSIIIDINNNLAAGLGILPNNHFPLNNSISPKKTSAIEVFFDLLTISVAFRN